MISSTELLDGVKLFGLKTVDDTRGSLTEIFRHNWIDKKQFIQWNFTESNINTFRGVQVHLKRNDFLVVLQGSLMLGLLDLRESSPTYNQSQLIQLTAKAKQAVFIPDGVAHGFYFSELSRYIVGFNHYWDPSDDLVCHWETTKEYIPWPVMYPVLSEKDQTAQSLDSLRQKIKHSQFLFEKQVMAEK